MALPKFDQVAIPNIGKSRSSGILSAAELLNQGMSAFQNIADTQISRLEGDLDEADTRGVAAIDNMASEFTDSGELAGALEGGLFDDALAGLRGDARLRAQDRISDQITSLMDREEREQRMDLANRTFNEQVSMNIHRKNVELAQLNMQRTDHRHRVEDRASRIRDTETARDIYARMSEADMQTRAAIEDLNERYSMYIDEDVGYMDLTRMDANTLQEYRAELDTIHQSRLDIDAAIQAAGQISDRNIRNDIVEDLRILGDKSIAGTAEQQQRIANVRNEIVRDYDLENNYFYTNGTGGAYTPEQVDSLSEMMAKNEQHSSVRKLMANVMGTGTMTINIDGQNETVPVSYPLLKSVIAASTDKNGYLSGNIEKIITKAVIADIEKSGKPVSQQMDEYRAGMNAINRATQSILPHGTVLWADNMRAAIDSQLYFKQRDGTSIANTGALPDPTLFDEVRGKLESQNLSPSVSGRTNALLDDLEGILNSKGISPDSRQYKRMEKSIDSLLRSTATGDTRLFDSNIERIISNAKRM